MLAEMFYIFECLLTQNPNSLDSSRTYGRLLENLKLGSRESFLLENEFRACYTVTFPKKTIKILDARKPTKGMKFTLQFFSHALLHMNSA